MNESLVYQQVSAGLRTGATPCSILTGYMLSLSAVWYYFLYAACFGFVFKTVFLNMIDTICDVWARPVIGNMVSVNAITI